MAYVNVAEWKTDQVCEWLKGLDNTVLPYVHSFMNHGVSGQQLLSLRPEDLEHLGVLKLGHQEIILEAVEYLRNFHYELDRENLQLLALRLSCQAHSLHNELSRQTDSKPVTTQTLSDVASVVMAVKPLVRWLDRPPFSGQLEYSDKKTELMKLSLEMATCAQRDRFAEKPIEEIRTTCGQLAKLGDYIIQDIADPMILQPASLDLATLKKRPGDDLGFYILPSFHGAHQIAEIKFGSAAHQCGKMEEGDEIVQVNYQTVVGWERKNVLELFRESPAEVLLTLKRRPRHTKVYGQIYIKPYRLPSNKKTSYTTRWQHNLPSPRPELLTIPDFTMPLPRHIPKNPSPEPVSILDTVNMLDTMATDSSDSDSEVEPPLSIRLYSAKPRNLVQRRATIPGASPTTKHGIDIEQFWKELKQEHRTTFQLRDKAASCAHGLDNVPSNLRPQTCLGIEPTKRKKRLEGHLEDRKVQFQEKSNEIEGGHEHDDVRRKHSSQEEFVVDGKGGRSHSPQATANIGSNSPSDTIVPSNECNNSVSDRTNVTKSASNKAHGVRGTKERGKLDKSYSTPAYDLTDAEDKEERKFLPLEGSICKLDLPAYSSKNECNANSSKTDLLPSSDIQEEQKTLSGVMGKGKEGADFDIVDDLVQNVYTTDERIRGNDNEEQECVFRVPEQLDTRNTVYIKVSDVSYRSSIKENQSNTKGINQDVSAFSKGYAADNRNIELNQVVKDTGTDDPSDNCSLTQDSSEEKSESISSYVEGMYSSSSDGDTTLRKFGEILETIDSALTEHTKFIERNNTHKDSCDGREQRSSQDQPSGMENAQSAKQNSTFESDRRQQCNETKNNSISQANVPQPCRYVELPKLECAKKVETKPHSTPPEPPPRKYFTKPTPLDFSSVNASKLSDNQEKPQVPERPSVRRDFKKVEMHTDNYARNHVDHQERSDTYDSYLHSVEKSIDFIDEPSTAGNEQRSTIPADSHLYTECIEKSKEERTFEKYEPFVDKFGPSTSSSQVVDYYRSEHTRNMDYTDGLACSRQYQSPDPKLRACDKDRTFEKGVVNRAMMVARSIGLHGSLSKSSTNSPRTCRKRNTLLAKKRSVSVKDVGSGDLEGWLTYRSRGAGGAWAKAWFVLKCSSLYRFRTQDSLKADCLIALTGFTVSQAAEVKSRKYAFKVYHTGTVFYFAADTDDSLVLWLDAVNRATLGTDAQNRSSGLFSETDDSDTEYKSKPKSVHTPDSKPPAEKSFGSLKKVVRKEVPYKDHEIGGASLDRKYLKFLGARNQNLPVPTAQFRSYRKVLPMSTPNKKQDSIPNSPDLQMTIAGSTFYGLSASQSATDMSTNSQDMGDYRRTSDRSLGPRNRRPDELHGFMTLEEFMLSQQDEEQRQIAANRPVSPRVTPLISDHVHIQHRNFNDTGIGNDQIRHGAEVPFNNGVIYGQARTNDEALSGHVSGHVTRNVDNVHTTPRQASRDLNANRSESRAENANDKACGKCKSFVHKKWESACTHRKKIHDSPMPKASNDSDCYARRSVPNEQMRSVSLCHSKSDIVQSQIRPGTTYEHNGHMYASGMQCNNEAYRQLSYTSSKEFGNLVEDLQSVPNRLTKNDGYSGSSGDLTSHASSETLQRAKKDALVSRKGSFNLTNRCREHFASDKHWLDSLRRNDKKSSNYDKNRLKNVAQYQPPPIPTSPFEQDGMKAAFEMHLDKNEQVQKANRLKSLFSTKCQQKPCTLELPKETQKTLLGSPRLHRALFRDKNCNQSQQRSSARSDSQSPGDSGISQSFSSYSGNSHSHTLSQSFSSASSVSDWSPDTLTPSVPASSKCNGGHSSCQKGVSGRNSLTPPTLPYVPPPTSPPPDYPGLEYPPVFEPGTYSLSDASLLRNRSRNSQNNMH